MAALVDHAFGTLDPRQEAAKSALQLAVECIGLMWLYGVIIYVVRNLVELIPSPLDGIAGFDHFLVKELKNATVFVFVFLYFQRFFKAKMKAVYARLFEPVKV